MICGVETFSLLTNNKEKGNKQTMITVQIKGVSKYRN